ncbi:EamA family transporter [Pseudonocardia xinjiangensis]|uniref:EamA family transporter n=1 Tax=Pseudonocardia xinjiangensis TaxID=75289 RepID=A0ABX1RMI5_9PSEU|nr:EamA family transporter [Pseudonocardia xinjiangensis]NMH81187.1 EamA family transporter [Pseudonocardia xinjiangensis]
MSAGLLARRDGTRAGLALALASAAAFGLSGPFAKALTDAGWSASGAVLVRLGGAAVILLVILAVARPGVLAAIRADGPALLLYGLLAMAGVQVAFFNALQYLPVTVALLLEYLGPILVIGWVWLVRGQPPGPRTVLGAGVALVGLSMVVQVWSGIGLRWEGLAWGFAAAVCQAAYFLMADRAGSTTPPLVLAGVGMTVGAVVVGLLGAAGVLPVVVDTAAAGVLLAGVDVGWPVAAALLIGVSSVVAYLTGLAAIARIGAARGSLVALLEVVASAVASWLLLGQVPTAGQAFGGALILVGVALTSTARPAVLAEPDLR